MIRKKIRKLKRIQFDLDDELIAQLDILRQETGCGTRRELLRSMIVLFQWAVTENSKGNFIASIKETEQGDRSLAREYHSDILESLRQRSAIQSSEKAKT
jgi:metal-responsive CopG/Arc/MetJ family transcriptional regulator